MQSFEYCYTQEVNKKLNPEMGSAEVRLGEVKEEYNELTREVEQLKGSIESMDYKETFKQIVKMEHELDRNGERHSENFGASKSSRFGGSSLFKVKYF